jgi:glucokinase
MSVFEPNKMPESKNFLGLDIGGTRVKAIAFSETGEQLAQDFVATSDDGTQSWLKNVRNLTERTIAKCTTPVTVGVAAPGLASADRRSIAFMPGRLSGLEGLDWQAALNLQHPVTVLNDAQAALLGEIWLGAANGKTNVIMVTLGTGVGGAAMVDGQMLRGHIGRAGHLGHLSLNPNGPLDIVNTPGSLEDAIGECSILRRSAGKFSRTQQLVDAYKQGSRQAAEIWLASVKALAAALAGLINLLDPELIVIGGGIANADESLFGPLQVQLDKFEWRPGGTRVRIVKAALGEKAGSAGAAYGAKMAAQM